MKHVLVLGSSHSGPIVQAMRNTRPDVQSIGGQVPMNNFEKFRLFKIDDRGRLLFESQIHNMIRATLEPVGLPSDDLLALDLPFIFPLTMLQQIALQVQTETELERHLSAQVLGAIVEGIHLQVVELVRTLCDAGKTVVVALSPGMRSNYREQGDVYMTGRRTLTQLILDAGAAMADVTDITCNDRGVIKPEYWVDDPNDVIHANARWSELMAQECFRQLETAGNTSLALSSHT